MAENIKKLLDIAEKNSQRTFIIDAAADRKFSYGEFQNLAAFMISEIKRTGLEKGDRVILCLPNCVEFAALYFAAIYTGVVAVPLNINLNQREKEYIVKITKPRMVIYSCTTADYLKDILDKGYTGKRLCILTFFEREKLSKSSSDSDNFVYDLNIGDTFQRNKDSLNLSGEISSDGPFSIMFTSGTTQSPKGVVHSLKNMMRNAASFIKELDIRTSDRFYNVLSMAYMGGFYNLVLLPFLAEASVVLGQSFNAKLAIEFWKIPIKYDTNKLWLVPTILSILLKLDRGNEGINYCKKNIRYVLVATAPLPVKLRKDFEQKYGIPVLDSYGLSETLFVSANLPNTEVVDGSVGKVLPDCAISILNAEKGASSLINKEGEIVVSSEDLMLGYLNENTGEVAFIDQRQGFNTGDIGYIDADKNLFITGRKKDLIIQGGVNISPLAIENVLMRYKGVERCAVVGMPHLLYGEDIIAVVKIRDEYIFEDIKREMLKFCEDSLSMVQRPRMIFEIDTFPMTATRKIDKNKLKIIVRKKLKSSA